MILPLNLLGFPGFPGPFRGCSLRTVNSFKGICGLWQGEHSKMPEANYLLSVSWGYIKVGSFDSVMCL